MSAHQQVLERFSLDSNEILYEALADTAVVRPSCEPR